MNIREWQKKAAGLARRNGFVTKAEDIHRSLLLIVGEVTEAQNELRNGRSPTEIYFPGYNPNGIHLDIPTLQADLAARGVKPEGFPVELADVVLRVMNLADDLGIDLQDAIELKHNYNETRSFLHGGKRF